ncbi:hypothetical protein SDC9_173852 [bioreactor metagenome]|uniref:Uncharacterized protein n=1 Tax=bioreactor metagenome TaxID=1076179 RepID=A0A645GHL4_9ZZZZ
MDVLTNQAQAPPHVHKADHDGLPCPALKHQPGRILLIHADAKMVRFNTGLFRGAAGADLQHMRAQAVFLPLRQMIGIILHKKGCAVSIFAHGLQNSGHGGHLPVAFSAVAIALGH